LAAAALVETLMPEQLAAIRLLRGLLINTLAQLHPQVMAELAGVTAIAMEQAVLVVLLMALRVAHTTQMVEQTA
jgi:hypothetical protein